MNNAIIFFFFFLTLKGLYFNNKNRYVFPAHHELGVIIGRGIFIFYIIIFKQNTPIKPHHLFITKFNLLLNYSKFTARPILCGLHLTGVPKKKEIHSWINLINPNIYAITRNILAILFMSLINKNYLYYKLFLQQQSLTCKLTGINRKTDI